MKVNISQSITLESQAFIMSNYTSNSLHSRLFFIGILIWIHQYMAFPLHLCIHFTIILVKDIDCLNRFWCWKHLKQEWNHPPFKHWLMVARMSFRSIHWWRWGSIEHWEGHASLDLLVSGVLENVHNPTHASPHQVQGLQKKMNKNNKKHSII